MAELTEREFVSQFLRLQADQAQRYEAPTAAQIAREEAGSGGQYPGTIGWSRREAGNWSLIRAAKAALTGDWSQAGLEREVSQLIAQRAGREISVNSFMLPIDAPYHMPATREAAERAADRGDPSVRAAYQVGTGVQGGNLVATMLEYDSFITVLRNQSVTAQLGATVLSGLVGNVNIPRQSGATTTFWAAESAPVTESEATFDQVQLRPKTVGALSKISRLMLAQGTPAIEQIARQDLLAQLILAIDLAAISGTGASNQPLGIVNTAGIGSVIGGTNGANWSFDHFMQLYTALRASNAPMSSLGFAFNAKTYGYLSTLKSATGAYLWIPNGGGITGAPGDTLRGYRYAVSNQLRSTLTKGTSSGICSEAIFGNWNELLIAEWGTLEVAVNQYDSTGFTTGDVFLRALQTIDIGVRHPASFAAMSDGLTPGF